MPISAIFRVLFEDISLWDLIDGVNCRFLFFFILWINVFGVSPEIALIVNSYPISIFFQLFFILFYVCFVCSTLKMALISIFLSYLYLSPIISSPYLFFTFMRSKDDSGIWFELSFFFTNLLIKNLNKESFIFILKEIISQIYVFASIEIINPTLQL